MKIGIIDVDGRNFPNIALMKLSAHHKSQGDDVEWYSPFTRYDLVYKAKVFSFTPDHNEYINAEQVISGGTGYAIVYVLVNHGSTIEEDLDRIYTLRDMGYWAYVMIYDKEHCAKIYRRMQRWCNNRFIFARCQKFEDYGKENQVNERQLKIFL